MADACIHLMALPDSALEQRLSLERPPLVNTGCGQDLTIAELAGAIRDALGSRAEIAYDPAKPDGTPQKLLDIGLIRSLGWQPRIPLADGLRSTYESFLDADNPG